MYEKTEFELDRLKKETDSWEEVVEQLAAIIPLQSLSDKELQEAITERVEKEKEERSDIFDDLNKVLSEAEIDYVGGIPLSEFFDLEANSSDKNNRDYLIYHLMSDYNRYQEAMKQYKFIDIEKPSVGDYLIFEAENIGEKKDTEDYNFDFTEDTIYRTIAKVVGENTHTFDSGAEAPKVEYEFVELSDELMELYLGYHIVEKDNFVLPSDYLQFTVRKEEEIDDIEVKVEGGSITPDERYVPPFMWFAS